ncbi:MAG: phosphatase PAP2 family protein [Chthoniobacterales bacterium]|nr:phosphatase PAP2 family protein [Chthoniobacterales bacterium]
MNGRRARYLWLLVGAGAGALGAAFFFDGTVHAWFRAHRTRPLTEFMRAVSTYGDWPSHIIAGLVLSACAYFKGNKRWLRVFVAMILACALAGVAARVIKVSAGRARPNVRVESGWNGPRFDSEYHAFPSGHTASSTAFFGVLVLASWRIGAAFLALPVLIALSRMQVGAHHLSDVIAGAFLGALVAWLVFRVLTRREQSSG